MIIELQHETEGHIGRFQAPVPPRIEERVRYDETHYTVNEVRWLVEEAHDQNVESVQVLVTDIGDDE